MNVLHMTYITYNEFEISENPGKTENIGDKEKNSLADYRSLIGLFLQKHIFDNSHHQGSMFVFFRPYCIG
jgi:hypothetical protein